MHHSKYEKPYFELRSVTESAGHKLLKHINALFYLFSLCFGGFRAQKNDVIVYLGTSSWFLLPVMFYAKVNKIKIYHERTELPSLMVGKNFISRLDYRIYRDYLFKHFDGVFLINNKLKEAVSLFPYVNIDKLYTLNMMVDMSRFLNIDFDKNKNLSPIVFCGDLSSSKDNVDILIEAFSLSLKKHPKLTLKLIGNNKTNYYKKIIAPLIHKLGLNENVISVGLLPRTQIPLELASASLLVLSRENSLQAQYGFPTKLGEYLASGTPVVVTETSEISSFLKNGESSFLAQAGSVESFSHNMNLVFSEYENACEIGTKGRIVAEKSFCSLVVAKKMVSIIEGGSK